MANDRGRRSRTCRKKRIERRPRLSADHPRRRRRSRLRFSSGATPTFVAFAQKKNILASPAAETGVKVLTVPDMRWARRDIKSIALLAQVLAKQAALDAGCQEAWMVDDDGFVTEGSSSTAFILTKADALVTRPNSTAVLPGCTRKAVQSLAAREGLTRRGAQLLGRLRPMRRRRPFSPAPPISSCRSSRSTAVPSDQARRARRVACFERSTSNGRRIPARRANAAFPVRRSRSCAPPRSQTR